MLAWLFTIGAAVQCLLELVDSRTEIVMPVSEFWPRLPRGTEIDGVEAEVVGGGFSQAEVVLEGLSGKAQALNALGILLFGAVSVVLGLLAVALCTRLLRGPRQDTSLVRNLRIGAGFVLIAGFVAQYFQIVAGHLASAQALDYEGASWSSGRGGDFRDLNDILGLPMSDTASMTIDIWPLFLALGLLVVAASLQPPAPDEA